MRPISAGGLRCPLFVLLTLALAVPLTSGCSTLGIATVDDLTAMETRLESSNRATTTRVDNLEKEKADLQQTFNQISADIDTLNTRFARAKVWLENMNLDTVAADAQEASKSAIESAARSQAFLVHYLEWLKTRHDMLQKQITTLETQMKQGAAAAEPEDSADDEASSGGGS